MSLSNPHHFYCQCLLNYLLYINHILIVTDWIWRNFCVPAQGWETRRASTAFRSLGAVAFHSLTDRSPIQRNFIPLKRRFCHLVAGGAQGHRFPAPNPRWLLVAVCHSTCLVSPLCPGIMTMTPKEVRRIGELAFSGMVHREHTRTDTSRKTDGIVTVIPQMGTRLLRRSPNKRNWKTTLAQES